MALTSLVEAIALAASRVLQIDEGELAGWWAPVLGGRADEAQIYLYDLLPGGAGYARAVGDSLDPVLEEAERLLSQCDCVTSCYRCIRHYGNAWIHASLDRHLALAVLRAIRRGEVPNLDLDAKRLALRPLADYLRLKGVETTTERWGPHGPIPLVAARQAGQLWMDVHHALIDPTAARSSIAEDARAQHLEYVSLDAFELAHDLPRALDQIRLGDVQTY